MSAFIQAMNSPPLTKQGVNGSDVYTEDGVGHPLVALATMLVRGHSSKFIQEKVTQILRNYPEMLTDLVVLAFQTRDIRGGKGERDLFYTLFQSIVSSVGPIVLEALVRLIPEYGCWRDLWVLYESNQATPVFREAILRVVKEQVEKDEADMAAGKPVSLLAKWLPREGAKKFQTIFEALILSLSHSQFLPTTVLMMMYRKRVSALNKYLKTVEINMCNGAWAEIAPGSVPGRNLKMHTKAFLNEKLKNRKRTGRRMVLDDGELRYPEDADRMKCRENFQEHLKKVAKGEATMKGAHTVYPHELVIATSSEHSETTDSAQMVQAQWESIRQECLKGGALTRMVPLSDVSSSMYGIPMEVSVALGILISEINHPAFRNHVLTFHTEPSWVALKEGGSLHSKVQQLREAPWGGSTNFQAAVDLILQRMVEHRVPIGEEPQDLLVLTDMGFDAAVGGGFVGKTKPWQTHVEMIREAFQREGEKIWGAGNGWKAPRIVIWNLRAAYEDFHAKADEEGVVMLSGWSPAVLRVLQGEQGVTVQTPLQALRVQLDDPRYDAVCAALVASSA